MKDGRFIPASPDVLGELRALRDRANALGDVDGAAEYLRYIDLLSDVYGAFLHERPG